MFSEIGGPQPQEADPEFWELATPDQIKDFQKLIDTSLHKVIGQVVVSKKVKFGELADCHLLTTHDALFEDKKITHLDAQEAAKAKFAGPNGQIALHDIEQARKFMNNYGVMYLEVQVPGSVLGVTVNPVSRATEYFYNLSYDDDAQDDREVIGSEGNYPAMNDQQLEIAAEMIQLMGTTSDAHGQSPSALEFLINEFLEAGESYNDDEPSTDSFIDFMSAAQKTLKTQETMFTQEITWFHNGRICKLERSFPVKEADQGTPRIELTYERDRESDKTIREGYLIIDEVIDTRDWYELDTANEDYAYMEHERKLGRHPLVKGGLKIAGELVRGLASKPAVRPGQL